MVILGEFLFFKHNFNQFNMKNLKYWIRQLIRSLIFCLFLGWKRTHILGYLVS